MQRGADVAHAFRIYAVDHGATPHDWRLSLRLAADHARLDVAVVIRSCRD
jgi:acetyl esterase